jgi:hypothetical protein
LGLDNWPELGYTSHIEKEAFMPKKVRLTLVGLNGNAYSLLGAFQQAARRQGWKKPEVDAVLKEATSGDYDNLLRTLSENCDDPIGEEEEVE